MQIVEVKNNLVKINYDTVGENLILSGFVMIKDANQSFIAQVIHLEANSRGNFAVAKLLFNFDDSGVITNYNGSIPAVKSVLDVIPASELLELLPAKNPILIGELAGQNTKLNLDLSLLEKKLLICDEKKEDTETLVKNLARQLANHGKKLLVITTDENLEMPADNIIAGTDFKLPLNYDTINYIYETGLTEAKPETKALVQEVFLEVQNYVKTLPEKFIPFDTFKSVVDEQYEQTELVELVLLKNKLLKYYEEGAFAQNKDEFNALKISLKSKEPTLLNLSKVSPEIQREMISYAFSLISQGDKEVYVLFSVHNSNSDKKLLKQIYTTEKAFPSVVCSYGYKYLNELKQLSKNLILFAPIQQQNDFAFYNTFLSKLNPHEFIIYGESSHHMPLIVKLEAIKDEAEQKPEPVKQVPVEEVKLSPEDLDEQIRQDVDALYTAKQSIPEVPVEEDLMTELDALAEEPSVQDIVEQTELTEEDLDLLEDLNIADNEHSEETHGQDEMFEDIEIVEHEPVQNFEQVEESHPFAQEHYEEPHYAQPFEPSYEAPAQEILPSSVAAVPIVPVYSADIEPQVEAPDLIQGDVVTHPKYGRGTVEKLISYGSKTLCSINFDNVGRRLLDPNLAELKKTD